MNKSTAQLSLKSKGKLTKSQALSKQSKKSREKIISQQNKIKNNKEKKQEPKVQINSKVRRKNLQEFAKKLRDTQNIGISDFSNKILEDLKQGCNESMATKQVCGKIITEMYENKNLKKILREISEYILPLMVDVFIHFSERSVTNLTEHLFSEQIVSILSLPIDRFCSSWVDYPKSTFLGMIFDQILFVFETENKKAVSVFRVSFIVTLTKYIQEMEEQMDEKLMDQILQIFHQYLVNEAFNFVDSKDLGQNFLLSRWALSSCYSKCANKDFFRMLMSELTQKFNQQPSKYIQFMSCLLLLFEENQKNDKAKFIVLLKYQNDLLNLIQSPKISDSIQDKHAEILVKRMFKMAKFCEQTKKNHVLEKMVKEVSEVLDEQLNDDDCESSLYRMIICIEKTLPNYPLQFYEEEILENPGIFHLHFMDGILEKREQNEVKNFMIALIQKWIGNELRDFNILNLISKYMMAYLRKEKQYTESIVNFFEQISIPCLIGLNLLMFQAAYPDMPKNELYISVPSSLSSDHHQSQVKACGYAGKTLYLDRFFPSLGQLISWSPLLIQVYDDWFYYPLKCFYYLISYSLKSNERIKQLIIAWQQELNKGKSILQICSIFQIILCIEISNFSLPNVQLITKILLTNCEKIINFSVEGTQNLVWKQTMKAMENHQQFFQNYKREEEKNKKIISHFIASISRFFHQLPILPFNLISLIPNHISYEEAIGSIKEYYQIINQNSNNIILPPPSHSIIRQLSQKASNNIFAKEGLEKINNECKTKLIRSLMEIIRQIIFAYLQVKNGGQLTNLRKIITQSSALQLCLSTLECEECTHLDKEKLACKILALETLSEIYACFSHPNASIFKEYLSGQEWRQKIPQFALKILFRDPKFLIAKYEKKMILFFRVNALSWVMSRSDNILSRDEMASVLWHMAVDEQIQIRIEVLSILTNIEKTNSYQIQHQSEIVNAIMILVETFDARRCCRSFCQQITRIQLQQFDNNISFSIYLGLYIGFLAFNSQFGLSFYDLFETFCKHWLKQKDSQYLFYLLLEQLEKKNAVFRTIFVHNENIGDDLKISNLNFKTKKGWINKRDEARQKTENMMRNMKQVIIDRNKSTRYIKSKKDSMVDWNQIQQFNFFIFPL